MEGSTLEMYRSALKLRRELELGKGLDLTISDSIGEGILSLTSGPVTVLVNTTDSDVELPEGDVILASTPEARSVLAANSTVWMK